MNMGYELLTHALTNVVSVVKNIQDVQLWHRDRAAGCVIVLTKSGRLELRDSILRTLYASIFNHCDIVGLQIYRVRQKTQNKGYYYVLGHSRSSRSVPIESPYATSYL